MQPRQLLTLALAAAALGAAACGKDSSTNPNGNTVVFVGTVNGDDGILSGSVTFTVDGSAVTGTFGIVAPSASSHALTGTYDAGTKILVASGDGYDFGGAYDGASRLEGAMTGAAVGTFVARKDDNNTASAFCGTFTGDDDGVFNFTVTGSTLSGTATTTSGTVIPLDGTMSGSSITIANPGGGTLATGTLSGSNVSGTWDNGLGSSGTWTGSRCN